MTTNTISIQDFVSREIIYCVSNLIYTLNQEGKLNWEYWNLLESIDWNEAEAEIQQNNCIVSLKQQRDYFELRIYSASRMYLKLFVT